MNFDIESKINLLKYMYLLNMYADSMYYLLHLPENEKENYLFP